jgi:hypothetical protein
MVTGREGGCATEKRELRKLERNICPPLSAVARCEGGYSFIELKTVELVVACAVDHIGDGIIHHETKVVFVHVIGKPL